MTTVWSSPRDELPESVHALMALWGGFDAPSGASDCGLEKRLELDFRAPVDAAAFAVADVAAVMAAAGEALERHSAGDGLVALTFGRSVVVLSRRRVVLTAASSVLLHAALRPLLDLLAAHAVGVEWASFMRMNTRSPWTATCEMSDMMAQEYAALKSAFPTGNAFLTGPVDREHFFNFVYDSIDRSGGGRREEDVQLNVYMFNIDAAAKSEQRVSPRGAGAYDALRVTAGAAASPFASFETNALRADCLPELLRRFAPDRFTVVALQDRHCAAAALRALVERVDGYAVLNRAANHLAEGYAYHQTVFVREA